MNKFANVADKKILFIDMPVGLPDNIKNKSTEFVNSYQRGQMVLNQSNEKYVARNIVPIMDYIINTKETESLQIVDYASNCSAKVIYGFDEFS